MSDYDPEMLGESLQLNGHKPGNGLRILREYWTANSKLDVLNIDIAMPARQWLRKTFLPAHSTIRLRHQSTDGTVKLLVGFVRGGTVECVLMPSHRPDRAAACISSQVGCAMGCDFCASTKNGLERNLGVGEIVEQFMHLRAEARKSSRRIASLVFMGMGEPMQNLDNIIPAIRLLAEPGLGSLGNRAMTVSTVGIVPGIDRLAEEKIGVHLALSLHAPDDMTRNRLVPSNRRWPVDQIMEAAKRFQDKCRRPVNIEYCMLHGINDSDEQAHLLAKLMRGFCAHVNLIPYNSIGAGLSGMVYHRPFDGQIARFEQILRDENVVVHIRQTRGDDIAAACGQLRSSAQSNFS
ncbi:MAG TPA: 23S rRNA (adenine(2503)-C(2))-methyltransferase RlmN [Tepidisphaeraceae bacterium]|nr:23S rRNA (adenine(2503)-C(2))-methyltransferase RlmN [Tepidisphaeraceae bacterium]